jgi:iron complex transport system substrate-binding protein
MHPRSRIPVPAPALSRSRSGFFAVRPLLALLLLLAAALAAPLAPRAEAQATPVPAAGALHCGADAATPAATFPLTITDDLGRAVAFDEAPARIVSIVPSNTEILFALGLGDRVVAVDAYSDFPAEAQDKPKVGDYLNPDLEGMVAADPDLVLAAGSNDATVIPALERLGVPVVALEPENVADVMANVELIATLAGEPARGRALACDLAARIAAVEAAVAGADRPRVFFEISTDLFTAGPGSFIDDLITRAGGQNVAADAAIAWPQLSAEAVVAADPEVILLVDHEAGVTPETVAARPGWAGIAAVRNGRVVNLAPDPVVRPGPRLVDGLEAMARAIHPERFGEDGA